MKKSAERALPCPPQPCSAAELMAEFGFSHRIAAAPGTAARAGKGSGQWREGGRCVSCELQRQIASWSSRAKTYGGCLTTSPDPSFREGRRMGEEEGGSPLLEVVSCKTREESGSTTTTTSWPLAIGGSKFAAAIDELEKPSHCGVVWWRENFIRRGARSFGR